MTMTSDRPNNYVNAKELQQLNLKVLRFPHFVNGLTCVNNHIIIVKKIIIININSMPSQLDKLGIVTFEGSRINTNIR